MTAEVLQRTYPEEIEAAMAKHPPDHPASAVVELLYLAQAAYGRLTADAIEEVAGLLDMPPTRVRGLVGFYALIMERPHGRFVVHYCNDLPCALRGADEFLPVLCEKLGTRVGETSEDGLFTVRTTKCVAACNRAPVIQVNLEYYYDLTPDRLDEIIADLRQQAADGPLRRRPLGGGPPSTRGEVRGNG